jgi:predicted RNA-binding protein with PIN domain
MPYLIDGHNLIPHISGLSLDQLDDEEKLITILKKYLNHVQKRAILFFDQGNIHSSGELNQGNLIIRFIKPPSTADRAIKNEANLHDRDATNYTVVTSDRNVADYSKNRGLRVLSSANFAKLIFTNFNQAQPVNDAEDDIEYWLKMFNDKS